MKQVSYIVGILAAALLAGCSKTEPPAEAAKATTGTASSMSQSNTSAPAAPGGAPAYAAPNYGNRGAAPR
jgi:PBP1b-binding outer membrane lipoprotein LpoB